MSGALGTIACIAGAGMGEADVGVGVCANDNTDVLSAIDPANSNARHRAARLTVVTAGCALFVIPKILLCNIILQPHRVAPDLRTASGQKFSRSHEGQIWGQPAHDATAGGYRPPEWSG